MPYRYLAEEATADVAIEVSGETLEEVFQSAADATLNVMIRELDSIQDREGRPIEVHGEAQDLLLFDFLERLIYFKDAEQLLLRVSGVRIEWTEGGWSARAEGRGERLDPARHAQGVDVKAVTLHELRLERIDRGWRAHLILDI